MRGSVGHSVLAAGHLRLSGNFCTPSHLYNIMTLYIPHVQGQHRRLFFQHVMNGMPWYEYEPVNAYSMMHLEYCVVRALEDGQMFSSHREQVRVQS